MALAQFGTTIPNLTIHGKPAPYPVLNERDARAAAGIMLVLGIIAFVRAFLLHRYEWIDGTVLLFLVEFTVRQVNPALAPFYALGTFLVRKQQPEWVGAAQKRFAWALGLLMATTVAVLIFVAGARGTPNAVLCLICLALMWLESALGICVGCKIYHGLLRLGWIRQPAVLPACPGGVCALPTKKRRE